MVEVDDGLFEADRDEQADDNGGDVNEEALPGMQGFMRCVDFQHGFRVFLNGSRYARQRTGLCRVRSVV